MYFFQLIFSFLCIQSSLFGMQQALTHASQKEVAQNCADTELQAALDTLLIFEEQGVYKPTTLSPNGALLAAGSHDGLIVVADVETGKWENRFKVPEGSVDLIVWSPNSTHLASKTADGSIYLWDVKSGTCEGMVQADDADDTERSCHKDFIALFQKYKKPAAMVFLAATLELLYNFAK